jgi:hypothetical protein
MKRISIEKIIADCDKSMKLCKNMSGSFLYRKDEAIKAYLEELLRYRATGLTAEEILKLNVSPKEAT